MIMILKISESKGAEFPGYEFFFKKNIHITFSYLSKCPFDTLTADCEYSRSNREKLPPPVQLQLSKNQNILLQFYRIFGI